MYFAKFSNSQKFNKYPADTIFELDKYFASLTRDARERIDTSSLCTTLGIHYEIAKELLELCVSENLLEKRFAVRCPQSSCQVILEIIPVTQAYDYLSKKINCDHCDAENLLITGEDISPIYRLLDKPLPPPCEIAKKKCEDSLRELSYGISNIDDIYDIFFCPNSDKYTELQRLFHYTIDGPFASTTAKGDSLNDLCIYLLNLVSAFSADKTIRKEGNVNQIDCAVHNSIYIKPSVFEEMGLTFYCECKHENTPPNNTYYHKLIDILSLSHYTLGIIFSICDATEPCKKIAKDTFLDKRIIMINITLEDLRSVIFEKYNFLKLIAQKIFMVKSDAVSSGMLFD